MGNPPSGRRTDCPHGSIYIMTFMRTNAGINKAEDAGRKDAQIGFADALQRVFPPVLARYVVFHGWIRQEALCDRSSATFLYEARGSGRPSIGHQAVVVEGNSDAVGVVEWQHPLGATGLGLVLCFQNHYSRCTGALSHLFSTPRHSSFLWIGAEACPTLRIVRRANRLLGLY